MPDSTRARKDPLTAAEQRDAKRLAEAAAKDAKRNRAQKALLDSSRAQREREKKAKKPKGTVSGAKASAARMKKDFDRGVISPGAPFTPKVRAERKKVKEQIREEDIRKFREKNKKKG